MTMQEYVSMLLAHMGCQDVVVEIKEDETTIVVSIQVKEEDSGMMIGRRGETIEALQKIFTLTFRDKLGEKRVTIAMNDYLERRLEVVTRIAEEAVERVSQAQQPYTLPYLSSEERRFVHTLLKERGVETESDGVGRDRRLTVFPVGYLTHTEE